ncbi:hypothetical protein K439DRAFT_1617637 [Ramaria rubella]|nr:hypothetical protein K439DRAFT_1617637 [Ramaria rubella]
MSASASISPAVLAPALLPLPLVFFLQGVFLIQVYHCTRTHAPSWRINSPYTKTHVFLLVVLSLVHVGLLTAVEYNIFVSNFGVVDTLARADASVLGRCSKLSASLLSLTAQAFFAT